MLYDFMYIYAYCLIISVINLGKIVVILLSNIVSNYLSEGKSFNYYEDNLRKDFIDIIGYELHGHVWYRELKVGIWMKMKVNHNTT